MKVAEIKLENLSNRTSGQKQKNLITITVIIILLILLLTLMTMPSWFPNVTLSTIPSSITLTLSNITSQTVTPTLTNQPTPSHTVSPTITITSTPFPTFAATPFSEVIVDRAKLYIGPDTWFDLVVVYPRETLLAIEGRNSDGTWLNVIGPDNKRGWIQADKVRLTVEINWIPVIASSATPTSTKGIRLPATKTKEPPPEPINNNPPPTDPPPTPTDPPYPPPFNGNG